MRTFEHITWAMKNIHKISPMMCRCHGANYTLDKVRPMYEEYFQSLLDLHDAGWYQERDRKNLDFLSVI